MTDMLPLAVIAGIVLLVAALIALSISAERKRKASWEGIAQRNGYRFDPALPVDEMPFQLFTRGHSRKHRNAVSWTDGSCSVRLSDYQYTVTTHTGKGSSSHTYRQTICLLRDPGMALPAFFMRKERAVFDWLGQKLGAKDIDFPEDEAFSRAFVLKGDEASLRGIFDAELRALILTLTEGLSTLECAGDALLVNCGKRIPPDDYGMLVGAAMQLHAKLAGRSGW